MIDRPPGWILFRRVPLLCQLRPQWEDPDVFLQHLRSVAFTSYFRPKFARVFQSRLRNQDVASRVVTCDVSFSFPPLPHPLAWASKPQVGSLRPKCDWVVPRVTLTHIFQVKSFCTQPLKYWFTGISWSLSNILQCMVLSLQKKRNNNSPDNLYHSLSKSDSALADQLARCRSHRLSKSGSLQLISFSWSTCQVQESSFI